MAPEHRKYKELVQKTCQSMLMKPLLGDVKVGIRWYRARKAGDADGRWKGVLDAIQGFAYFNDSQIKELRIKIDDNEPANARIVLEVTKL